MCPRSYLPISFSCFFINGSSPSPASLPALGHREAQPPQQSPPGLGLTPRAQGPARPSLDAELLLWDLLSLRLRLSASPPPNCFCGVFSTKDFTFIPVESNFVSVGPKALNREKING